MNSNKRQAMAIANQIAKESQQMTTKPKLIQAEPYRNREGSLCGLCDGTSEHEHPEMKCLACGVVGLEENMRNHVCSTKPKLLSAPNLAELKEYFLEPPYATEATKEIESLFKHIAALEVENARLRGVLETIDQNWGTQIATSQEGGSFDNKLHIYIQNRLAALKEGGEG